MDDTEAQLSALQPLMAMLALAHKKVLDNIDVVAPSCDLKGMSLLQLLDHQRGLMVVIRGRTPPASEDRDEKVDASMDIEKCLWLADMYCQRENWTADFWRHSVYLMAQEIRHLRQREADLTRGTEPERAV